MACCAITGARLRTSGRSPPWGITANGTQPIRFPNMPLPTDSSRGSARWHLQVGYKQPQKWQLAVDVFNLFNKKWDDIQYYYASRLQGEPAARPDFVVHPGVPLTVRARVQYFF